MSSTTKVSDRSDGVKVGWTIPDFPTLCTTGTKRMQCTAISFLGCCWAFEIRAEGVEMDESLPIAIHRSDVGTEMNLFLRVGFKRWNEEARSVVWQPMAQNLDLVFVKGESEKVFRFPSFTRDAVKPLGTLTIDFAIMKGNQAIRSAGLKKLSDDLTELIQSEKESDFTVSVQGETFHLHRNILGARLPVFGCMLEHEMVEKTTGAVSINDCEPESFRIFVRYLYSSKIDGVGKDTLLGLYKLADKYQVDELKSACLDYAQRILSVETFCDIFSLALTYDLQELLNDVANYFSGRKTRILATPKWMEFLKDHPIQANDLIMNEFGKKKETVGNKRKR